MTTPGTRRVVVVSRFLPDPHGPASARLLHGFAEGLREIGRDFEVRSWWPQPPSSDGRSDYVRWQPLPIEASWRLKARALVHPRSDVLAGDWSVPGEALAIAEEPLSFPAVRGHPCSVLTVHYSPRLDHGAVPGSRARLLQDRRAERSATRSAAVVTAYSLRVAQSLTPSRGALAGAVPAAISLPPGPFDPVDAPVAACVADWTWPANQWALRRLMAAWPIVREQLPVARLLLAGAGLPPGEAEGVSSLGPVARSDDVLGQAAALVFACPPTSGPKVKVLEAAAAGLAVLTTAAGCEGLDLGDDSVALMSDPQDAASLAAELCNLLTDPGRRAAIAARARARIARTHAPAVAAKARMQCIERTP
jgi:glycosyltransferase involved in cell wall biosynthesis